MIEVLRLVTGKLLICVGRHCIETDGDDASLNAACKELAEQSGVDRTRIIVAVTRATLGAET